MKAVPGKDRIQASAPVAATSYQESTSFWRAHSWHIAAGIILFVAALIRLWHLDISPLHHDEGVNGNFLVSLYRNGYYRYDPQNYHGPSLYYFALLVTRIAGLLPGHEGLTSFAIKLVPAIFGIALVWLALKLRRELGDYGSLGAAILTALSPGSVYFSRYFIHEILFIFFSLAIVVSLLFYVRTMRRLYLLLLSASVALLVGTKETSVITLAVLGLAYACTAIYERLGRRSKQPERLKKGRAKTGEHTAAANEDVLVLNPARGLARWRERLGERRLWRHHVIPAVVLFLIIHVCLFTSFFGLATATKVDMAEVRAHHYLRAVSFDPGVIAAHLNGVLDSVRTYETWTQTGQHAYLADWDQYLTWMGKMELATLLLGTVGIVLALTRMRSRFGIFLAFYAAGELFAYSLIPYKTPWLTLSILLPFWLAGGYAVGEIADAVRKSGLQRDRVGAWAGVAVVVAGTGWQSIDLSHIRYDDNSLTYVYAHTRRSFLEMTDEIDRVVKINNLGPTVGITVMAPEHWPLPWYTRNYPNSGYWGKVVPTEEALIVGQDHQREEILRTLGDKYDQVGTYDMRPGVILNLYVRKDLAR